MRWYAWTLIFIVGHPVLAAVGDPSFHLCLTDKKIKRKETITAFFFQQTSSQKQTCDQLRSLRTKDNRIQVRRRGNQSDHYAKKQYQLEFSNDISLLSLSTSDKWVLNAPYVDRAYIRNPLAYALGREVAETRGEKFGAPQTRFVDLYINDEPQGVYILTEKIQRQRLDLPKLSATDDSSHLNSFLLEISMGAGDFKSEEKTGIRYRYPSQTKIEELEKSNPTKSQNIQDRMAHYVNRLESAILSKNRSELERQIDLPSFIDYMILQEAFKNIDGYRRSAYFYKRPNGKITMGPLWDFDIAFGNFRFWKMHHTDGWLGEFDSSMVKKAFWFEDLLKVDGVKSDLITRYRSLRSQDQPLSNSHVTQLISKLSQPIKQSAEVDRHIWQDTYKLSQRKVMRTDGEGANFEENVQILKTWLLARLAWMDQNIQNI